MRKIKISQTSAAPTPRQPGDIWDVPEETDEEYIMSATGYLTSHRPLTKAESNRLLAVEGMHEITDQTPRYARQ